MYEEIKKQIYAKVGESKSIQDVHKNIFTSFLEDYTV
jgi:hypothetical protein